MSNSTTNSTNLTNDLSNKGLSYKDAGVDIDAGDALVERIKPLAKKTMREGVLAGIGGFGALFEVILKRWRFASISTRPTASLMISVMQEDLR